MLRAIDKAGPYDFATLRATPDAGSTIFGLCAFGDADTEILLLWRVYVDAGSADLVLWSSTSSQFWVEIHSAASESTTGRVYCCLPAPKVAKSASLSAQCRGCSVANHHRPRRNLCANIPKSQGRVHRITNLHIRRTRPCVANECRKVGRSASRHGR